MDALEQAKKELGFAYNPIRWLIRRFVDSAKADEIMIMVSAMIAGDVD